VEPLACCVRAVRRTGIRPGDTAVIVGLGSIGCLFVQLLKRAGALVVGCDMLADRVALARRLGADAGGSADPAGVDARALGEGRGADHVIVPGGGTRVLPWAVDVLRDGGAVHCFAGSGDPLPISLDRLYRRELTITATYSSSPADLAEAFRLIEGDA